ncbi:bifunctional diguanylate cyclase/phosphodiesterase [Actinoplanes sp. TFC3]|uniref:putative bifunctional diguanylate cyclase/phosphodiesterase n=1 Tax=Actinoplanes sp. TFC3 TaxID=1710355 RepID=UPI00137A0B17|nr:EAL domain-containing protein [Actinoplanes sp. TFC3]
MAIVLIAAVVAGQAIALIDAELRPAVLRVSLVVLNAVGVFFSVKAARHAAGPLTWRLIAASRVLSLVSGIWYALYSITGSTGWQWAGALGGMAMFVCLAIAATTVSVARVRGAQRWGFVAEVATVFFSGLMLAWYFVLAPAAARPGLRWLLDLGSVASQLMALAAVTAVLLRGAVTRLTQPLTVLFAGTLLYAVSYSAFSAATLHGSRAQNSFLLCAALITASLLMTVAAILASSPATAVPPDRTRILRIPPWLTHLPYVGVGLGNTLMLVVTVRQHALALWGGLSIIQTAMTTALAVRQIISLRESRRLNETDPLTGLANLTGLHDALQQALQRQKQPAVMLLDLDGFKQVNDRYGHDVGDRLLIEFARLLRDETRHGDVAARIGGDEFVVVLEDVSQDDKAVTVAERILASLDANPVPAGSDTITIKASIGLATARPDDTAEDLKRRADLAMYESKRSGNHGWKVWDPAMTDRRTRDTMVGDALLQAVGTDQFTVVYQPVVDLGTRRPVGMEALLRWQHPQLGAVSPMEFIPIAERIGVIHQLGMSVLRETCEQLQRWRTESTERADLHAAVNISAIQLKEPLFLNDVLRVLTQTGLPAEALNLEITESAIVDEDFAIPVLEELRRHGIKIAIDDFGTGYSSLHQLTQLPVDVLKIDRSFVAKLDSTTRGAAVAEAIIRLAQVLCMNTLAEGVETAAQATELQLLGCHLAQGYLFAKPLTAQQLTTFLNQGNTTSALSPNPPAN